MSKKKEKLILADKLVDILEENHLGEKNAVSGKKLSALLEIEERRLRKLVNFLIFKYGTPVVSSATPGSSGYYLAETEVELERFYRSFRTRGCTGLIKAAHAERKTLLEMSLELVLEQYKENDRIPGATEAFSTLLDIFSKNPELYTSDMDDLRKKAIPVLVTKERLSAINEAAKNLQELSGALL